MVINGYKRVKEALVEKGEDYIDRPVVPVFDAIFGNKGSVFVGLFKKLLMRL